GDKTLNPLFTLSMNNKTLAPVCLYTRKGEVKDVAQLKGKKWGGICPLATRYILYKNGFDMPIDKFFSQINYIPDMPITNVTDPLLAGKIDVFTAYESVVWISGALNKKNAGFEPAFCEVFDHTWVFAARKTFDPALAEQMKKIMLNAHKDKDFAQFKFAFQMVNGRFVPIEKADMAKISAIAALAEKKGWKREEQAFFKKYSK
ncbi:MAG TPA: hypothetical protein PLQ76_08965, partial [bacterium]|nr:hypothetical protein [bacterium]